MSERGPTAEGRAGVNQVQRVGAERGPVCVQLREASPQAAQADSP